MKEDLSQYFQRPPKQGNIIKIQTPVCYATNMDELRAEVAAWTKRAA